MAKKWAFKYQLYKHLQANAANIYAECRKAAEDIGITGDLKGNIGLTGAVSGCHGLIHREIEAAMEDVARKVVPNATLDEKIRDVVKEYYGDGYDAALISTCEAALNTCYDVLCVPPTLGRGDAYRARYIAPYEKHMHHQGAYGKPFPPKYKEVVAERGEAAGEYGVQGKRAFNLDTIFVKPVGATYDCHGIKYNPIPNMLHVDAKKTIELFDTVAQRHLDTLAGIASLAYDTPGYGYAEKAADGAPVLLKGYGALAEKYDIPYIVDNAWGVPFVGTDIRKINCDVIMYSMDKASYSPTCGLIIGKEEPMVLIRRALGIHGARYGTLSSHGKASHVGFDPGKEALAGALAAMRILKDRPQITLAALDDLYRITMEEFEYLPAALKKGWTCYKSINSQAVELNYYDSWTEDETGFPVFSIEDMYAGSHIIQVAMAQMGLVPSIAYDGNIFISNGVGNIDEEGKLIEKPTRLAVKAMFKIIEIVGRYSKLID